MEAAWTKAINLAPNNAAAWSNRGTARLQNGKWQAAYDDLSAAARLEEQQLGSADGLTLNNLGNAEGALGRWQDAMRHYEAAADDADVGSIALANYALAAFEMGDDEAAIKSARTLLRRCVRAACI
jgi:tetratricopeptide (TPR) repeat protein